MFRVIGDVVEATSENFTVNPFICVIFTPIPNSSISIMYISSLIATNFDTVAECWLGCLLRAQQTRFEPLGDLRCLSVCFMALYFLFSLCMHSALVHHLPHNLSIVNVVATSFYLPSLRQTKSIRMEADFQIFNGPSSGAIPEIIAIKKFKIYLHNITFIGNLSCIVDEGSVLRLECSFL